MSNDFYESCKVGYAETEKGIWKIEKFTVEENSPGRFYYMVHGRDVTPGNYTRLMCNGSVMMSDTPAELQDFRYFVRIAKGRILINGLGLGCITKALLSKLEVTHIDVVEIDKDVIDLIVPYFEKDIQAGRLTIYHGDAMTFKFPPKIKWDYVYHDIWIAVCTDDKDEMINEWTKECD